MIPARIDSLLDRVAWVQGRGDWRPKRSLKWDLDVRHRVNRGTLLDIVGDTVSEFVIAEVLFPKSA